MLKAVRNWEIFNIKFHANILKFTEFNEDGSWEISVSLKYCLGNKQRLNNDNDYILRGL
jgi:hypothetical protein